MGRVRRGVLSVSVSHKRAALHLWWTAGRPTGRSAVHVSSLSLQRRLRPMPEDRSRGESLLAGALRAAPAGTSLHTSMICHPYQPRHDLARAEHAGHACAGMRARAAQKQIRHLLLTLCGRNQADCVRIGSTEKVLPS